MSIKNPGVPVKATETPKMAATSADENGRIPFEDEMIVRVKDIDWKKSGYFPGEDAVGFRAQIMSKAISATEFMRQKGVISGAKMVCEVVEPEPDSADETVRAETAK